VPVSPLSLFFVSCFVLRLRTVHIGFALRLSCPIERDEMVVGGLSCPNERLSGNQIHDTVPYSR
jgi:hypothetical protein